MTVTALDQFFEVASSLWMEAVFLIFFPLGFAFFRRGLNSKATSKDKKVNMNAWPDEAKFDAANPQLFEAEGTNGTPQSVLALWKKKKDKVPLQAECLKHVLQALLTVDPASLTAQVTAHIETFSATMANSRMAAALLDVVARAGELQILEALSDALHKDLQIHCGVLSFEVLLGGYATDGNEERVQELLQKMKRDRVICSPRAHSLIMKGFLKNGKVDAVMAQMMAMRNAGLHVPCFAVTQLFRVTAEAGREEEFFKKATEAQIPLNMDAIQILVDSSAKQGRGGIVFATEVEAYARGSCTEPLQQRVVEALLRINTSAADKHALDLFEELLTHVPLTEGLCVGLLARCADAKFLRFAEEIARAVRKHLKMTISMYSALMKVYAYSSLYDKACDLYEQILEDGLQPDSMMYGCLMKFAVECGRTDLSRKLAVQAGELDIQSYMSLIRAAGRDKDIEAAFKVLGRLRDSQTAPDLAVYNCVLDVCVTAGDMARADELVQDMRREVGALDIISYNTLMKGYCMYGKIEKAKRLLEEMRENNVKPNDVSYNSIINACVTQGKTDEAWTIVDSLRENGVSPDHFTISIMMKSLKKAKRAQDVQRALDLLDRANIDITSDEILLNTALEMCIRHKELRRLDSFLAAVARTRSHPSIHTYGTLIKASALLKRMDKCWEFWRRLVDDHGRTPNCIVFGCMLDALVSNGQLDEALELLEEWKEVVEPNAVIYSTLVKGYAMSHQADKALKLLHRMRSEGVKMNTIAYNAAIDSQARVGAMQEVYTLLDIMREDGCQPDSITHSTVVKGFCIQGDLDKAFEVFRTMQESGMTRESIIYNTLLDGCTRHGRMDLADMLMKDFEDSGIVPTNFTLGILVKMYGRRAQLEKAFEIVDTWPQKHGFTPNAQVWTCLMCACIHNGETEQAIKVFERSKALGHADAKGYAALLNGLARQGQFEKAVSLVEEAYGLPVAPGARRVARVELEKDSLDQLMYSIRQKGLMEEYGLPLLERLRAAGIAVSTKTLAAAMQCGRGGKGSGGQGNGSAGQGTWSSGQGNNWSHGGGKR